VLLRRRKQYAPLLSFTAFFLQKESSYPLRLLSLEGFIPSKANQAFFIPLGEEITRG